MRWMLLFFVINSSLLFSQTRIIPHVTAANGGFSTQFIATNPSDLEQQLTLTPYLADGQMLANVTQTLTPGETRTFSTNDLFGDQAVSHVIVDLETTVKLTIAYQVSDGSNSPAHIGEASRQAMRWRIYPGTQNDVLDGLAVVNLGDDQTDIYVRQVSQDGVEQGRVSIGTPAANGKSLYLFGDFQRMENAYFEVFADNPLAVTALRFANGISNARFFWETSALELPPLIETPVDPRIGQTTSFPPNRTYDIVGGQATIVDERTIRIDGLTYSGAGPDVRIYLGKDGDYLNGFPISGKISGGQPFNNATLTFTLPEGRTLDDFNGISIWCTVFLLDFSSGTFQKQ